MRIDSLMTGSLPFPKSVPPNHDTTTTATRAPQFYTIQRECIAAHQHVEVLTIRATVEKGPKQREEHVILFPALIVEHQNRSLGKGYFVRERIAGRGRGVE